MDERVRIRLMMLIKYILNFLFIALLLAFYILIFFPTSIFFKTIGPKRENFKGKNNNKKTYWKSLKND